MTGSYQYFMIPFESVPREPAYIVWFASWSAQRPDMASDMPPPFVIGITTGQLPAGATLIGNGSKDPPPCPPALAGVDMPAADVDMSPYLKRVKAWLDSRDA